MIVKLKQIEHDTLFDFDLNPALVIIKDVVLSMGNWVSFGSSLYRYTYNNSIIKANSIVSVVLHKECVGIATNCGILPTIESIENTLYVFSEMIPNGNIIVDIQVMSEGETVEPLPDQTGKEGMVLSTDGTNPLWIEMGGGSSGGNVDGGSASSIYLPSQNINGGNANG